MEAKTVLYDVQGPVAVLRLNRPRRMNAVIEQLYLDLQAALEKAGADRAVRAVVLTGSVLERDGRRKQAFCAGADLKAHAADARSEWQKRQYLMLAHDTCRRLFEFPKPVVAAINGPARGAGGEMALNCDFIIMADSATLAFTETSLGTFVGGGATRLLERLVGLAQARRLIYSGSVVDGREAVRLGLALASLPVERLLEEALRFCAELAAKAPVSLAFAKELINLAPGRDLQTVLLAEAEAILACMKTADWREGVESFAQGRQPRFKGE